ncbi:MAG: hypothetical protein MIL41_00415 [Hyphomicrobiales bacterium]|jgi:hypothetical protein
MGGSTTDIEALLVDGNDLSNPTPGMLPAIFRDIVGELDAEGHAYAVVGRIALTLHEQARFVRATEIVADLNADGRKRAADLVQATRARFADYMDLKLCPRPIEVTLRPCACATEAGLLAKASSARGLAFRRGWRPPSTSSGCGVGRTPSTITRMPPR